MVTINPSGEIVDRVLEERMMQRLVRGSPRRLTGEGERNATTTQRTASQARTFR